jgi:16S rRNA (guanine966-N2)-methyltransferase
MRIIAGTKRGMKLLSPPDETSRPILDRVKESIFSVLQKYDLPAGKRVADVFSGVGSFGLESLSRGAAAAVFVEKNRDTIDVLKQNIQKTGFESQAHIVQADAFKSGAPCGSEDTKFNAIFVDPPYVLARDTGLESKLGILLITLESQLAKKGLVIVRTDDHTMLLDKYGRLSVIEKRTWGTMNVFILGRLASGQQTGSNTNS